jgi:hypothetical protein
MTELLFELALEAVLWLYSWIRRGILTVVYGVEWVVLAGFRAFTGRRER